MAAGLVGGLGIAGSAVFPLARGDSTSRRKSPQPGWRFKGTRGPEARQLWPARWGSRQRGTGGRRL